MSSFDAFSHHLNKYSAPYTFNIGTKRLRPALLGRRSPCAQSVGSIRASPAQAQILANERDSKGLPDAAQPGHVEYVDSGEDTSKESLVLLEWPALCRQVAAFASTPMAAQRILLSGLPIGRCKVLGSSRLALGSLFIGFCPDPVMCAIAH